MEWVSRGCFASLAFLVVSVPAESRAAGPRIEVVWEGPPACSRLREVESGVRRVLRDSESEERGQFLIQVVPTAEGYRLEFSGEVGRDTSSRSLDVVTCEEAQEAALLLIVLALDPAGAARLADEEARSDAPLGTSEAPAAGARARADEARPSSKDTSGSPRPKEATQQAERSEEPENSLHRPLHVAFIAGAGLLLQSDVVLPTVAPAASVFAGGRLNGWRSTVRGAWFPEQSNQVGPVNDLSLSVSGLSGSVSLAHLWTFGKLRIGPELHVQLQSIHAERQAEQGIIGDSILYPTLAGGGTLEWELLPWVALALGGAAVIPLHRPTFVVDPFGPVFQPGPVSFCAVLDLIFSVPIKNSRSGGQS